MNDDYDDDTGDLIAKIADRDAEIKRLEAEVEALKDFAICMTGCGYDFCQHEYFIRQRDNLLKRNQKP